ncbi:MAG TPA: DUF1848 domain-containing protein [Thermomicrobiales bacterium]|nr:DUF1848 domain-containing protein [Thermomicrobiales bacterium]
MRVISASRRTDIPAFYSRWFLSRIRAGFCHWINPYGGQVNRVSLRPEDCVALIFWSRNPRPLLPHLRFLHDEGYRFYFHFTINGYPRAIESHNPPVRSTIATFRQIAEAVSPDLIHWRYDPILLSEATPPSYHFQQFDSLAQQLEGYTRRCYFSFVDFYGKTERNLRNVAREHSLSFQRPDLEAQRRLASQLRDIAAARGITLYSCCNDGLVGDGIQPSHCIDLDTIANLRPDLELHLRSAPTRQDCGCVECDDIGVYDTCAFGCAYCYATNSRRAALRRLEAHDPDDTVLWRPASLRGVDLVERERRLAGKAGPVRKTSNMQLRLFGAPKSNQG